MKRLMYVALFVLLAFTAQAQQAKYVFYFIGDGMGVNQVNGTEMYLAEQAGRIGVEPLLFTTFPAVGVATTYSASNSITDSSAAGTALATGSKTYNGAIGVDANKETLQSCFEPLQQLSGYSWGETISYREMRDDATNFFIPGIRKGTYVITYDVYANNAGTCASGMTTVQCQYAPQITAHTAGTDVTVE